MNRDILLCEKELFLKKELLAVRGVEIKNPIYLPAFHAQDVGSIALIVGNAL